MLSEMKSAESKRPASSSVAPGAGVTGSPLEQERSRSAGRLCSLFSLAALLMEEIRVAPSCSELGGVPELLRGWGLRKEMCVRSRGVCSGETWVCSSPQGWNARPAGG